MLSTAIDKQWKWPKCPWTKDWINKIWYVQAMKYYSIIKRNELLTYYNINEAWNTMKAITTDHVLYEWNVTICSDFRAQEEEGLILKLKIQYSGHVMQTTVSLGKTCCWERLRAEGEEGNRGWEYWMASPIQRTWTWANSGRSWGTGMPGVLQSMQSESWTWLSNWTTVWKVQNRQIYLESKYTSGCLGLEGEDGSDADG